MTALSDVARWFGASHFQMLLDWDTRYLFRLLRATKLSFGSEASLTTYAQSSVKIRIFFILQKALLVKRKRVDQSSDRKLITRLQLDIVVLDPAFDLQLASFSLLLLLLHVGLRVIIFDDVKFPELVRTVPHHLKFLFVRHLRFQFVFGAESHQ